MVDCARVSLNFGRFQEILVVDYGRCEEISMNSFHPDSGFSKEPFAAAFGKRDGNFHALALPGSRHVEKPTCSNVK